MGFLSKLKAQYATIQEQAAAMSGAEPHNDIPEFIAPRPQEEVDRLLQGTGSVRAIVLGKRHQVLEDGERVGRMRVHVRLRPRGPAGTLGDEVTVKASVSSWVATLIEPGLDIPVELDRSTGVVTNVDSGLLTEELSARKDEADRRRPGWATDPALQGMAETAGAIRDAFKGSAATGPGVAGPGVAADDPRRAPVSGVTWETYVAVTAHLQVHPATRGDDAVAQQYGVLPYTWLAVSRVWHGRIAADPALAELFEQDLAAARAAL